VRKRDTREIFAFKSMIKQAMVSKNQVAHVRAERDMLATASERSEWIVVLQYSFQDAHNLCVTRAPRFHRVRLVLFVVRLVFVCLGVCRRSSQPVWRHRPPFSDAPRDRGRTRREKRGSLSRARLFLATTTRRDAPPSARRAPRDERLGPPGDAHALSLAGRRFLMTIA
jgi:hypothetical protein